MKPYLSSVFCRLIVLLCLLANVACRGNEQYRAEQTTSEVGQQNPTHRKHRHHRQAERTVADQVTPTKGTVPAYVQTVLAYVREHKRAPDGYVGGRTFGNFERLLPVQTSTGLRLRYKEWDVKPKVQGRNRGAERLITGSDNHVYYTSDHYRTFTEIQ
jgi:guanyl-specific ribonuclease Sa